MKKKRVKKAKKLRKSLYVCIGIIAVVGLVILVALATLLLPEHPQSSGGVISAGKIRGITIGDSEHPCGYADSICPSEYAGCKECILPDPDCINVCGW